MSEAARFLADRSLAWAKSDGAQPSEKLVEFAGRVCYMSFSDDTSRIRFPHQAYLRNLIEQGHESVLEHANWSFLVDGVSRAFTHQLVRHRVGFSFSQLSQQYHDESDVAFVEPAGMSARDREAWQKAVEATRSAYIGLLEQGDDLPGAELHPKEALRQRRSIARSVLPAATETAIFVTANARSLRHFLLLRGTIEGDLEMRAVACALLPEVARDAPSLFADIKSVVHHDNAEIIEA